MLLFICAQGDGGVAQGKYIPGVCGRTVTARPAGNRKREKATGQVEGDS